MFYVNHPFSQIPLDFDPLGLPQRVAALVDGVEPSFLVRIRIRHQNISVVLRLTDGRERDGWCRTTVVRAYASHLHCHYCALSRD